MFFKARYTVGRRSEYVYIHLYANRVFISNAQRPSWIVIHLNPSQTLQQGGKRDMTQAGKDRKTAALQKPLAKCQKQPMTAALPNHCSTGGAMEAVSHLHMKSQQAARGQHSTFTKKLCTVPSIMSGTKTPHLFICLCTLQLEICNAKNTCGLIHTLSGFNKGHFYTF